jgi:hypothetical protein
MRENNLQFSIYDFEFTNTRYTFSTSQFTFQILVKSGISLSAKNVSVSLFTKKQ